MTHNSSITANMNNMKGITLIELMVTLAVLAVLVAIGLPRMQGISQSNRVTTAINSLSADLALARSEAVTRNISIDVNSASGNNDWSTGWVVQTAEAVPVVLRTGQPLVNNLLLNGSVNSLTYRADGTQSAAVALTFKSCQYGNTNPHGRELTVTTTGRVRFRDKQGCP